MIPFSMTCVLAVRNPTSIYHEKRPWGFMELPFDVSGSFLWGLFNDALAFAFAGRLFVVVVEFTPKGPILDFSRGAAGK